MALRRSVFGALALCLVPCDIAVASPQPSAPLPDTDIASGSPNAFRIFNAVHSALRQWGSSVHHNGLSFFPVTIPEGNLFYHGGHETERPATLEWLAFEMEHASQFAQCFEFDDHDVGTSALDKCFRLGQTHSLHGKVSNVHSHIKDGYRQAGQWLSPAAGAQYPLTSNADDGHGDHPSKPPPRYPPQMRGYLQTYRAARPLNLIYLDGMAAAKCHLGTLDSQNSSQVDQWNDTRNPISGEWERATALCDLASDWGVDGFIRMEAGFEIIYCNFSSGAGLDLLSTHGSPWRNETHASRNERQGGEWSVLGLFEWMRASAARYGGLPRGRAEVDFSGMVSAFAYDGVNTTNPDKSRSDLPRILSTPVEIRRGIRDRLGEVIRARITKTRSRSSVDWQAVVDNIVTRFSERLRFFASGPLSARAFRSELATLLYPFLDFPHDISLEDVSEPISRCTDSHLSSVSRANESWTPEDGAIHAAVRTVSHTICTALFAMRREINTTNGTTAGDEDAARRTQEIVLELRDKLDWTTWKECGRCDDPEQVCFVPMFPVGSKEDYFSPKCKTQDEMGFGYFLEGAID